MPYLDTSLLGSYYCPEPLSAAVTEALITCDEPTISVLVDLEFHSLIALKVRMKELTRAAAGKVLTQYRLHQTGGLYAMAELGPRQYDIARAWLAACDTSLRTLDALHLACAFTLGQPLWTTDKPLAKAAQSLGVLYRLISA